MLVVYISSSYVGPLLNISFPAFLPFQLPVDVQIHSQNLQGSNSARAAHVGCVGKAMLSVYVPDNSPLY